MNKLLRYAGSKENFINLINPEINRTKNNIYVEPFLGSGGIFLNLEKEFDYYIINDIDPAIIKIFKTVKNCNYSDFLDFYNQVLTTFGGIKTKKGDSKEEYKANYYNFRNRFNSKLWKTDTDEEGFALIMLYNSCLNSLARWSKNGFNQSWGDRLYIPDETTWNIIKNKLSRTEIYNRDFFNLMEEIDNVDFCLFLDPPYNSGGKTGYNNISDEYYKKFIKYCKESANEILYTDIDHTDLEWNKIILRDQMRNISPHRRTEFTKMETMFINF